MCEKVSVIIVNWNGELELKRCLVALMAQTVMPHEIILLDNASTDRSLDVAKKFPLVQIIKLDRNVGFSQGNNIAIEAVSKDSEWIALLNPDASPKRRWLEKLLESARDHPGFDVFGSKLVKADESSILDGAGDAYHISGLAWRMGHGYSVASFSDLQCEIFSSCAAAALYRRCTFLKMRGFDEDYFCYMEDLDLGFRLRLAGYKSMYVPTAVVSHVGSASTGGSHSDFSVYHGHRNLVWAFIKNMPGVLFWLLLPLHVLMNLAAIVWFSLKGQGKVILRAKWDALKGIPKAWRKRKEIQSSRVATVGEIWRALDKSLIQPRLTRGWKG
ncbi:glycosyltransferase family 2 protein [Solemya velesiana gill symbiont]|uniref:Glycosyltransferase n=1 Tax=Solemya velesiana gill symbiont TaxID=1918948 RepID=A0A1T2KVI7_9GAMM|nr:glycosyltransferase family 2 protein [Solemya velesiana gill symbiont]OOZ36750.1 glycosyltransferase [Solemya velesiana gill symbiont]